MEQGRGPGNIDVPIGGWEQVDGDVRWNQILVSVAKLMQIMFLATQSKASAGKVSGFHSIVIRCHDNC